MEHQPDLESRPCVTENDTGKTLYNLETCKIQSRHTEEKANQVEQDSLLEMQGAEPFRAKVRHLGSSKPQRQKPAKHGQRRNNNI